MRSSAPFLAGTSLLVVLAVIQPAKAEPRVVDARVDALFASRAGTGRTLPFFQRSARFEATGRAPLLVRFRRPPTASEIDTWRGRGVVVSRTLSSGAVKVVADRAGLDALLASGTVGRVSVDLDPAAMLAPLDEARGEVGVDAAAASFLAAGNSLLTGQGVVVGDLDTSADIFHPALFRAAETVPWHDVDGDGRLTPGIDGVDVDGDATIGPTEILMLLDGVASSLFGAEVGIAGTGGGAFDPAWDYLFLDVDGDGRRGAGAAVDGAEQLGGLGEPLFVPDDVDGDGSVRVPERVVRLGASKVRAIHHDGKVFRQGEHLADFRPVTATDTASHGTRMLGTVAGGQRGSRRFVGVAPDAELVLAIYGADPTPLTDKLQFLLDEGVNVVLTEISFFGTDPSDGSTELELLIDSAVDAGVVVVSPAGNLGLSTKHDAAAIPPASSPTAYTNEIAFDDPATTIWMSATWTDAGASLTGTFELGDGDVIDLAVDEPLGATAAGRQYSVVRGVTSKQAGYLLLYVNDDVPLPAAGNTLALRSDGARGLDASLFLRDDASGYFGGANFADGDVAGNLTSPAFAAKTMVIGAYGLHVGAPFTPNAPDTAGALRDYSGRGPDLWGGAGVHVAAPDNPIAPDADVLDGDALEGRLAPYRESGGTSGAGAVAAGVVALFRQAHPELAGIAIRDAVMGEARADGDVAGGSPTAWGAGKLQAPGPLAEGGPRPVAIAAPLAVASGESFRIEARFADGGSAAGARARWDWNYDGTWDTEWSSALDASPSSTMGAWPASAIHLDILVEVMDADGWTSRAAVRVGVGGADDGGCGCRVGGSRQDATGWAASLVVLFTACSRGRRRSPPVRADRSARETGRAPAAPRGGGGAPSRAATRGNDGGPAASR